jgi:hypothetical protein
MMMYKGIFYYQLVFFMLIQMMFVQSAFSTTLAENHVVLVEIPAFSLEPINDTVCENQEASFIVSASFANSFQWQVDKGAGFVDLANDAQYSGVTSNQLTVVMTTLTLNSYSYRCVAIGVSNVNSSVVKLKVNPLPVITSENTATTCNNVPFTYTVTTGLEITPTFKWMRTQMGVNSANSGTTNDSFTETLSSSTSAVATYKLNATTAEGCTNAIDFLLYVTISPLPTGKLSIVPQACDGDSLILTATLTGTAPFDYTVSGEGMTPETISASNLNITTRNVAPEVETANYSITNLKDATGCTSVSMTGAAIQINPLPSAIISYDQTICQGTSAKIDFDLSNGTPHYNVVYTYYAVASPETITTVTLSNLTSLSDTLQVNPASSTVYKIVSVTDSKGCKAMLDPLNEAIISITPRPNVVANFPSAVICSGNSPNISLSSTVIGTESETSFKWVITNPSNSLVGFSNPGNGNFITDEIINNSGFIETIKYTVTPNYLGCSGTSKDVSVLIRHKTMPILFDQSNICTGTKLKLKTNSFPVGEGARYIWTLDPPINTTSDADTLAFTLAQDEVVQVTYIDLCGTYNTSVAVALKVKEAVAIKYVYVDSCLGFDTKFTPVNLSSAENTTIIDGWKWKFGNLGYPLEDSIVTTFADPQASFKFGAADVFNVTLTAFSEGCEVGKTIQPLKINGQFCTVGIENYNLMSAGISPNPATDLIKITLTTNISGTVSLVDLNGNIVLSKTVSGDQCSIDTTYIENGVYVLNITTASETVTKQVVLVK